MKIIVDNNNPFIEESLGLDKGSLVQEDDNYYLASKDGDDRVGIHFSKYSNTEIVIEQITIGDDEYEVCEGCCQLHPKTEMKKEVSLGYLCDRCQRAIESRGESLTYED